MDRFDTPSRTLTPDEAALHQEMVATACHLEGIFDRIKPGRHRSLALTALEEAVFRAERELRLSGRL